MSYREYLDDLVRVVFEEVFEKPRPFVDALMKILITDDLSSQYERPSREDVVVRHVSCFSKGTNILTIRIRKLLAYLDYNTGRDDHSDPPSQKAPAPADKATKRKTQITPEKGRKEFSITITPFFKKKYIYVYIYCI